MLRRIHNVIGVACGGGLIYVLQNSLDARGHLLSADYFAKGVIYCMAVYLISKVFVAINPDSGKRTEDK